LLRLQFACLGADIKFIDGYVAGDIDNKGVTAEKMVGFETNGGNSVDLDVPVNVANARMG
jgi:hypothetical protein